MPVRMDGQVMIVKLGCYIYLHPDSGSRMCATSKLLFRGYRIQYCTEQTQACTKTAQLEFTDCLMHLAHSAPCIPFQKSCTITGLVGRLVGLLLLVGGGAWDGAGKLLASAHASCWVVASVGASAISCSWKPPDLMLALIIVCALSRR